MGQVLRKPQLLTFTRLRKAEWKLERIVERWRTQAESNCRAFDSRAAERYEAALDRLLRAARHKGILNNIRRVLEECADVSFSRECHGHYSDLGYYVRLPAFPYRPRLTGYTSQTVG
jgi:hypothetical protein